MSNDPAFIEGITKREYFAGLALAGLLAAREMVDDAASLAVAAADQLIAELNNGGMAP